MLHNFEHCLPIASTTTDQIWFTDDIWRCFNGIVLHCALPSEISNHFFPGLNAHSCAILDGELRCWGWNDNAQVWWTGFIYMHYCTVVYVIHVPAHSHISVKCLSSLFHDWISHCSMPQLGTGDLETLPFPGNMPDPQGFKFSSVSFGGFRAWIDASNTDFSRVSCLIGSSIFALNFWFYPLQSHSCAVTSEGALMCWGANWKGQVGTFAKRSKFLVFNHFFDASAWHQRHVAQKNSYSRCWSQLWNSCGCCWNGKIASAFWRVTK